MSSKPLKIIQISDIHLMDDSSGELLKVNTEESFKAVIDLIKRKSGDGIDLIILSGDLSQDGSKQAYARIADLLAPLNVPIYCLPGNHDHAEVMAQVYPRGKVSGDKHIILNNWHFILLNSQIPGKVPGYLDASQLEYMRQCLQTHPEHHAMVLFHHQPVPVGSRWLDNLWLTNADEFWKALKDFSSVKAVVFGHVHQKFEQRIDGIDLYAVPSTCVQFKTDQDEFGLEDLPPGYRWFHLYEDGRIETGVERVAKYVGVFDKEAKGY